MKPIKTIIALLALATAAVSAHARVTLPAVMADNMVLQRDTDVKIWGKAAPGAKVTVTPSWDGM